MHRYYCADALKLTVWNRGVGYIIVFFLSFHVIFINVLSNKFYVFILHLADEFGKLEHKCLNLKIYFYII